MQALLIEALSNTDMTFDEVNYKLYALNRTIFNKLSQRSIAFYKFLENLSNGLTRPCSGNDVTVQAQ